MGFFDVFFAGVGLSMDAVAIGMTNGMEHPKATLKKILQIALLFGLFQALMPLGGYFLAKGASSVSKELFEKVSGWVAFVLLALIGGKMIFDCLKEMREKKNKPQTSCGCGCGDGDVPLQDEKEKSLSIGRLILQAIATSIDAFAVGISMRMEEISSFLSPSIFPAVLLIGVTTFFLVSLAVGVGKKAGDKLSDKAELAGGIVLLLIALKCLIF